MASVVSTQVEGGPATGRLVLPSGETVLFDEADRTLVEQYRWFANRNTSGNVYAYGYRRGHAQRDRAWMFMHRLLLDPPADMDVDHRNGDGLDNRRANLRVGTRAQNNANRRRVKLGPSGYRGVTWHKQRGCWQARIWVDGKNLYLGLFEDPWEAAQAYNAAALEAWGEFARLNERAAA